MSEATGANPRLPDAPPRATLRTMDSGGKKVIFLYPPSVMDDVATELSRCEYEVYSARDHERLAPFLDSCGGCLAFVNIDAAQKESDWEAWFRARMAAGSGAGYGIVTYTENKALAQKYLMDIGLSCGFIVLKIGAAKAAAALLKTLEANEARGRRKFVRSQPGTPGATVNAHFLGRDLRGSINDISSIGMSVHFEFDPRLQNGQRVEDFQLNLKGSLLSLSAILYGLRDDPERGLLHIFIFDPATMDDRKRDKVRAFVRRSLQDAFDKTLQGA